MTPNWDVLLASITRCNAVYEVDDAKARAAFAALGCSVIDRYESDTAQAVLHTSPDGTLTLTIAGTRFSEGKIQTRANDVFQDAEEIFHNHDLPNGAIVASGAHDRGMEIWKWASKIVDQSLRVEGHSLGGQTTHAMRCIIPADLYHEGFAWEPPKAANDAFYEEYPANVTTVINGHDLWAGHPVFSTDLVHPPGMILHLMDGEYEWVNRSGLPILWNPKDHDTDVVIGVVQKLKAG